MTELSKEQIDVAVDWWGEQLIGDFKAALRKVIEDCDTVPYLDVDYHPSEILWNALEQAGIILPWKTSMTFRDNGVQVARGYGEPFVELLKGRKGS